MEHDLEFPNIPAIDGEAYHPVRALAQSALTLQRALVAMAEGKSLSEVHRDFGDDLLLADCITEVWARHFGFISDAVSEATVTETD